MVCMYMYQDEGLDWGLMSLASYNTPLPEGKPVNLTLNMNWGIEYVVEQSK